MPLGHEIQFIPVAVCGGEIAYTSAGDGVVLKAFLRKWWERDSSPGEWRFPRLCVYSNGMGDDSGEMKPNVVDRVSNEQFGLRCGTINEDAAVHLPADHGTAKWTHHRPVSE
jgi:hypothetical protein